MIEMAEYGHTEFKMFQNGMFRLVKGLKKVKKLKEEDVSVEVMECCGSARRKEIKL